MKTRPLARRAGLDGFVTWFGLLAPEDGALPSAPEVLGAQAVELGLDFSFLPGERSDKDGTIRVACVLVAQRDCEVGFSVGSYRGVRWQLDGESGATTDEQPEPDLASGTGKWRLKAGPNVVRLDLDLKKASHYTCLRLLDAEDVHVGVPEAASEVPDHNAPADYLELNRPGKLEFKNGDDFTAWQESLYRRWLDLLGEAPEGRGAVASVGGEIDEGAYLRREIRISGPLDSRTSAYLLLPKSRTVPGPGVLAVHGHGFDAKDNVSGVDHGKPERSAYIKRAGYAYGAKLARQGCTVLVPDIRNFGARRDPLQVAQRYKRDQCDVQFFRDFVTGRTSAQAEALEWRAWLDVLEDQALVDQARIGVAGLSLGGRTSGLCAALDRRVKAAVVSGALNLMRERVLLGQGCVKYMLPGLLKDADLPELYALAAPRALFFEHGADDGTSPEVFAQDAWRRLEEIYAAANAAAQLDLHVFDGGHFFKGERSLPWLMARLEE